MRILFAMEQHVGHQSFYRNLRRFVERDSRIEASWVEVTYHSPGSLWDRLPGLPPQVKGTLVGRAQVLGGLRRAGHQVAFFNTQVPAALAGGAVRRQPYVLCTDITPIQYDQMAGHYGHRPDVDGWLARYKHRVNCEVFRQAAHTLAWSAWTKASLVGDYGVAPEKVAVLPPGVDLDLWRPDPCRLGWPLRVLFVGGDFARKGGEDLLAVFAGLPAGSAELVLVTRTRVPPLVGVFAFPDLQPNSPELVALCQSCDVCVLPSHAEAFGIAAVEASALGLPVIATSVGGLPDVVVDGETGFLIQPGDRPALAQLLRRLADDPELRLRLGRAARERAESRFDARANAYRIGTILCQAGERMGD